MDENGNRKGSLFELVTIRNVTRVEDDKGTGAWNLIGESGARNGAYPR